MPTAPRRTYVATIPFLAVVALTVLAGCKKEEAAVPAPAPAPAAAATASYDYKGISVQYPKDWTPEKVTEGDAVDIKAPAKDGDWQPGVYLQVRPAAAADADGALEAVYANLLVQKSAFHLVDKKVLTSPGGFKYGRVEYTNKNMSEAEFRDLKQWDVVVPLGDGKELSVQASASAGTWSDFEPAFAKIVDSIRLPKK